MAILFSSEATVFSVFYEFHMLYEKRLCSACCSVDVYLLCLVCDFHVFSRSTAPFTEYFQRYFRGLCRWIERSKIGIFEQSRILAIKSSILDIVWKAR